MKSKFALVGLLMLGACTTNLGSLSAEQQLQLGCKAVPVIVNDLALYRQRGELSDDTVKSIESMEGPVKALCKPGVTDYVSAAQAITGYLDTLLSIQKDVE